MENSHVREYLGNLIKRRIADYEMMMHATFLLDK
jgi:hypothetical protein